MALLIFLGAFAFGLVACVAIELLCGVMGWD